MPQGDGIVYQLLYTSLARGLKPGSSGFGVAACTRGLSPKIISMLEGMSGYKTVYPHYGDEAHLNPKSFLHYHYAFNNVNYDLLSKIMFSGADYSGRSNFLAHHILLEDEMRPDCGPGALCSHKKFFINKWEGEPRLIDESLEIPIFDEPIKLAENWEKVTGDAGWAGSLVENWLNDPEKPIYIIFEPSMDTLSLLREALALLPAEKRWDVTFNTYFTKQPTSFKCAWRFCLPDCSIMNTARRLPGTTIIDLTKTLDAPKGGIYVEAARTGIAPKEEIEVQKIKKPAPPTNVPSPPKMAKTNKKPLSIKSNFNSKKSQHIPSQIFQKRDNEEASSFGIKEKLTLFLCIIIMLGIGWHIWSSINTPETKESPKVTKSQTQKKNEIERTRKAKDKKAKADKIKADKIKADKIKADKIKADKIKAGEAKVKKAKVKKAKTKMISLFELWFAMNESKEISILVNAKPSSELKIKISDTYKQETVSSLRALSIIISRDANKDDSSNDSKEDLLKCSYKGNTLKISQMGPPLYCKISQMIKNITIGDYQYDANNVFKDYPGKIEKNNHSKLTVIIKNDSLTKKILEKLKNEIKFIKIESYPDPDLKWLPLGVPNKRNKTITLKVKTKQKEIGELKGKISDNNKIIIKLQLNKTTKEKEIYILENPSKKNEAILLELNKIGQSSSGLKKELEGINQKLQNLSNNKTYLEKQLDILKGQNKKIKDDFKKIKTICLIFDGVTLREYHLQQGK